MSKIKIAQIAGMKLADVVKKLRKRKYAKDSRKNVERARGVKTNKSVKAYNIRAKDAETKIIPVKKQSQKGSSFQTHRIRTKMGRAAARSEERGKLPSPMPTLERLFKRDVQGGKLEDYRLTKMYLKNKLSDVAKKKFKGGMMKRKMLTGGQAKLDKNKNNRIDAQDFKMLRAEKSKKKPMKAALGAIAMGAMAAKMLKGKKKKATKMPGAAGVLGGGVLPGMSVADIVQKKLQGKMGGGLAAATKKLKAKGLNTGGPVPVEKIKKEFPKASPQKVARLQTMLGDKSAPMKKERLFEGDRSRRVKKLKKIADQASKLAPGSIGKRIADKVRGKMGGGMMMKPMGYKSGKSVKVKCKLGRNKPTKMY